MSEKKNKEGLMIGFITDGMVPVKWMMRLNEMQHGIPSGMYWKHCWFEGHHYKEKGGYAKARTKVVEQARANNAKWLFFIDTDVFPPADVITRLMSHAEPIVTGIYYMKSMPAQPVIFKEMGSGPYWDYPVEELVEIGGAGLGCTLIDMDVFDKFEENGIDFFDEDWIHTKPDGSKVKVAIGEDHWFFQKSRELGYKVMCDTSVLCDHMDFNTKALFPGDKEVQKIRNKILKKQGRSDLVKREEEVYKIDPEKKTIVFYNATPSEFSGDELERRGVGGSEGDIINLARIFAKHFNVVVFCNCPRPGVYDDVIYLHADETEFMKTFKTDLFIASRNTHLLADVDFKKMFNIDKVCLWTHDLADSYVFDKLPKALKNIDRIFTLTDFHRDNIKQRFPMVPEKMWFTARNGVDTHLFEGDVIRNPYKLIYSSTPFRGLDVLVDVFPEIKRQVPQAELHVFSSMKVYGNSNNNDDKQFQDLYEKAKNTDGIKYRGTIPRSELAKEMMSAAVLAYPNHYPETCCITVMEAVTAGTPIVTTKLAALPEVIPKGCGVLLDPPSNSPVYKEKFIKEVVKLLKNEKHWNKMHKACEGHDFTWSTISKEWVEDFFPEELESYNSKLDSKPVKKQEEPNDIVKKSQKPKVVPTKASENWDPTLVKYREDMGGNLNTQAYWDNQYKFEFEKGINQRIDTTRFDFIVNHINDGDVVMDFGCGMGEFLEYLKQKKSCTLYGIDISKFALEKLLEKIPEARVTNKTELLPDDLKKDYFDVITAQHVIEHYDEPKDLIDELKPLLAKDGKLILAIPINDDEWIEHQKIWQVQDVIELLSEYDCKYQLKHRKETMRGKPNGEPVQEVIVVVEFEQ